MLLAFVLAATITPANEVSLPSVRSGNHVTRVEELVPPDWVIVSRTRGDLNADKLADEAVALWPARNAATSNYEEQKSAPFYRLLILFRNKVGGFDLVADNRTLLEPPGHSGAYEDGLADDALAIRSGALDIRRGLLRGHYRYRFRWQSGAFRLIGYDTTSSDGQCISRMSINYLSGSADYAVGPVDESRPERRKLLRLGNHPRPTMDIVGTDDWWPGKEIVGNFPECDHE